MSHFRRCDAGGFLKLGLHAARICIRLLSKRHFYGNKRKNGWCLEQVKKSSLSPERGQFKRFLDKGPRASSDGVGTDSGDLIGFLGLKLECLWSSFCVVHIAVGMGCIL